MLLKAFFVTGILLAVTPTYADAPVNGYVECASPFSEGQYSMTAKLNVWKEKGYTQISNLTGVANQDGRAVCVIVSAPQGAPVR